jgi:hypothetical protein
MSKKIEFGDFIGFEGKLCECFPGIPFCMHFQVPLLNSTVYL